MCDMKTCGMEIDADKKGPNTESLKIYEKGDE